MNINELLDFVIKRKASDIHLLAGSPPVMRVDGALYPITQEKPLSGEALKELITPLLTNEQKEMLTVNKELDFSFAFGKIARLRANVYHQRATWAASLRIIPITIPAIDELGLPAICHSFAELTQGLVLITGPTGQGKSTTLASILEEINQNRAVHIVTIEDPVEYVYTHSKSIISQREMRNDCHSWEIALRSVLREDPDVVMVGEMRDYETMAAVLTVAETGHLVFATLHTNSAAQTIDRVVDVFPPHQQTQTKAQLAAVIEAVFSQRLVPALDGGRVVGYELMLGIPAVKTSIREGKSHMIDNIIQTSGEVGMVTLENSLASLVNRGKVSLSEAKRYALHHEELTRLTHAPKAEKKGK
jgi:twitching motility protein PilT